MVIFLMLPIAGLLLHRTGERFAGVRRRSPRRTCAFAVGSSWCSPHSPPPHPVRRPFLPRSSLGRKNSRKFPLNCYQVLGTFLVGLLLRPYASSIFQHFFSLLLYSRPSGAVIRFLYGGLFPDLVFFFSFVLTLVLILVFHFYFSV